MSTTLLTSRIHSEHDVVYARQRARQIAALIGFDGLQQTRLATAVSEIARNAYEHAGGGEVTFGVDEGPPARLEIEVRDHGPGIEDLPRVLAGEVTSRTGLGLGLVGARRLVERFEIAAEPGGGTRVALAQTLPGDAPRLEARRLGEIADQLARAGSDSPVSEVIRQNQELVRTHGELLEQHAELERLNRRLQETDAAKNRFIALLGHELRNLLGALQSALDVMGRDPAIETRQRMEQMARRQIEHLTRLVDDLLDASKIANRKLDLHVETVDLRAELERELESWKAELERLGLEVLSELPGEAIWVEVDRTRFAQVLANLLSNAAKFTDPGDRVEVRLGPSERGDTAVLSVRDTGCGIAADQLETILEPFTQAAAARRRMTGGLGIGLSLAKALLEAQNGRLTVTSEGLDKGATFAIELPVVAPPEDREAATGGGKVAEGTAGEGTRGEEGGAGEPGVGEHGGSDDAGGDPRSRRDRDNGGRRILLIDDHVASVTGLAELLAMDGHRVEVAHDGPEGLAKAAATSPELVICDLGLPEMDGYEVARRLRRLEATAGVKIYALSGFGSPEAVAEAHRAGFDDHLLKPLSPARLQQLIADL